MKDLTIKQIAEKLSTIDQLNDSFITNLRKDDRKGVIRLLIKWENEIKHKERMHERFLSMTVYEKECRQRGFQFLAGIDEVGRGPLAGPVVAAAVILPEDFYLPGIDDSKKLTEAKREEYFNKIKSEALGMGIGLIDTEEIDRINIYEATKKAMIASVQALNMEPDFLLIDAMKIETPLPSNSIIKGDSKSISIAAASIVAKVTRDSLMKKMSGEYPVYGFERNMGYGTSEHLEAIEKYGLTPHHRKSFAPIRNYIE